MTVLSAEAPFMWFDRPLVEFELDELDYMGFERIETDPKYYPLEMKKEQSASTLFDFFEERVTPKSRFGIHAELKKHGFDRYSIAAILITSNGRDCQDCYWVRFEKGPQTWDEVWEAVGRKNYMSEFRKTLQGADRV